MNEEIKSALTRVLPFLVILGGLAIATKKKKIDKEALALRKPDSRNHYLLWTSGFLFFILTVEYILFSCGMLEIDKWNHSLGSSIIRITGAVILAPIAEELIFRGLILNFLHKKIANIHMAILLQACLFVLLHNFTYQHSLSSIIGIIQSLADAVLFGYARHTTRSIYTPITMHITGNLIATLERFIL